MHCIALIVVPENSTLEDVMNPYHENGEHPRAFWDWYQVGGRWSGLYSDYDPAKDPENIDDSGKVMWPTSWVDRPENKRLWKEIKEQALEKPPYTVLNRDTLVHLQDFTNGDYKTERHDLIQDALNTIQDDDIVYIVDYHT